MKRKSSFTLVELVIVIACVAALMLFVIVGAAVMVIPATGMARSRARMVDCVNNKGQLMKAMQIYACDNRGAFVYRGGDEYTYAAVLTGMNGTVKQYAPTGMIRCSLAKGELAGDCTNATGMLNAVGADKLTCGADTASGWLNRSAPSGDKFFKRFGRFAQSPDGKTVIYDSDRLKNPGGLLIFADTFRRGGSEANSYWNFTPDDASGRDHYVTLIHGGLAAGAFADGHSEGMEAERLKDCGTEVTAFNDDDFKKDKLSAR